MGMVIVEEERAVFGSEFGASHCNHWPMGHLRHALHKLLWRLVLLWFSGSALLAHFECIIPFAPFPAHLRGCGVLTQKEYSTGSCLYKSYLNTSLFSVSSRRLSLGRLHQNSTRQQNDDSIPAKNPVQSYPVYMQNNRLPWSTRANRIF